jgi:hypothetical protein
MKTITIAISLLTVVFGLSLMQNRCGSTKTNSVSAATVANLPTGKTYEIDLTRNGTVYRFNDADTDFNRVTIRTAGGVTTFNDLLKMSNTRARGRLLVGTTADLRNRNLPTSTGDPTNFVCGVICKCDGALDCVSMLGSGRCQPEGWCNLDTGSCFCVALP